MSACTDRVITSTFNTLFAESFRTIIVGGVTEPRYLPPQTNVRGIICYTRDYAASALHEIAHWCIAGSARCALIDYGYWYVPPPRSVSEQQAFCAVEARVQALERMFADVARVPFHLSVDDVHACTDQQVAGSTDETTRLARTCSRETFARQIERSANMWRRRGLPSRADRMCRALKLIT